MRIILVERWIRTLPFLGRNRVEYIWKNFVGRRRGRRHTSYDGGNECVRPCGWHVSQNERSNVFNAYQRHASYILFALLDSNYTSTQTECVTFQIFHFCLIWLIIIFISINDKILCYAFISVGIGAILNQEVIRNGNGLGF